MSTFAKTILSGSTDGRGILVAAIATAGTTIHTAQASNVDGEFDEVWLYAMNTSEDDLALTLEWGGVTDPDDLITLTVPAQSGLYLIVPGLPLHNTLVVKAFAETTNLIVIHGFVNRITA